MRYVLVAVVLLSAPAARAQDASTIPATLDQVPVAPAPQLVEPAPPVAVEASAPGYAATAVSAPAPVYAAPPAPAAPAPISYTPAPASYAPAPVSYAPAPVRYVPAPAPYTVAAPQYTPPPVQYVHAPAQPMVRLVEPNPQYAAPVAYYSRVQLAPQLVWPAQPQGYVLVPIAQQVSTGTGAGREELYDDLHRTETRLDAIEGKQLSLGGPITFMILGYGGTLIASAVALSSYSAAEDIKHARWSYQNSDFDYDVNNDGQVNHRDEQTLRHTAYGFAAATGLCLLVGIASTIRLASRISERKALQSERAALQTRRASLRRQLDFGVSPSSQQLAFSVQGRY